MQLEQAVPALIPEGDRLPRPHLRDKRSPAPHRTLVRAIALGMPAQE